MKTMVNILIILATIYLLICAVLFYYQDKLIFFPMQSQDDLYDSVSQNEISFSHGKELRHGWNVKVNESESKTVIYFGGNAQDVVYLNFEAESFKIHQLIAVNHPGYGKSTGTPSQISLYDAALQAYDWSIEQYKLNPDDIIVMGRSLGSSVATYLAANREIKGLVLITPFDSIENIAASQYKYFPVKYLMKHAFPTVDYISQVQVPTLMLAAENDEIIAHENLQKLKQNANGNNRLIQYPNVGHNSIQEHKNYYPDINRFLDSL